MAKLFNLEIITPERTFYRGEVESVIVNTVGGQMGVLKGNAPLVTALVSGDLKIQKDGKWYHAANSNGFMEVTPEKVIIFCQTVFWPSEMEQNELLDKERRQREARMPIRVPLKQNYFFFPKMIKVLSSKRALLNMIRRPAGQRRQSKR